MQEIALGLLFAAPFLVILFLANSAESEKEAGRSGRGRGFAAIGLFAMIYFFMALFGLIFTIDGVLAYPEVGPILSGALVGGAAPIASELIFGVGLLVPSLLGLVLLVARVPNGLARQLGMTVERENVVHTVALAMTMLVFVSLLVTLGMGLGNLAEASAEQAVDNALGAAWLQCAIFVLVAMVGVGWIARRGMDDVIERLGVASFSWSHIGLGVGLGVLMAPVILILVGVASTLGLEPDADVEALNEVLTGPLFATPIGILTLGFAAGIGEELLLRGALQPRFGLWVTAALFAFLHSNYGVSLSTLIVLVAGLALGLARLRYNTTTTIFMHAAYNITLGLLGAFASSVFEP